MKDHLGRAHLCLPLLLSLLAPPSSVTAGEPGAQLSHPHPPEDPRWLRQLPPPTIPLEKPAERAAVAPRLDLEPLADEAPEETAPADTAGETRVTAEVPVEEETEDTSMIEVLETLPIAGPMPQAEAEPAAAAEPTPEAVSTGPAPDVSGSDGTSRYRWHVQLLAGRSLARVKEDQRLFVLHYGDLLQGLSLTISQSRYGDARDAFYRLRAVEWTGKPAAVTWCSRLLERGHQCLVTRIRRRAD